ncbi:MAG: phosphoribosylglycinamide formyltransferase [Paludibacteraceae bacterium]|nr:phosphoribosylglycinamide formyltransferase [Paludibacteraceae bacterium]
MLKKIAIFASGSGSNAENIVLHFNQNPSIKVNLILTNNSIAGVLDRAKRLNVPTAVFSAKELKETNTIPSLLKEYDIDFVVLAGFLLKVPDSLIKAYPNRIVNIHPALLPKYGGKGMYGSRVHEAVVAAGEKESGITIHYINEHYDEGNIIFQGKCEVSPSDTPDDVANKVHELEYKYYPSVIENLLNQI